MFEYECLYIDKENIGWGGRVILNIDLKINKVPEWEHYSPTKEQVIKLIINKEGKEFEITDIEYKNIDISGELPDNTFYDAISDIGFGIDSY